MKMKATRNYIRKMFDDNVYCTGYCALQHIMIGCDPVYYNCGINGWNFDCYVDYNTNTAVTTGYSNTVGIQIPKEIIEKYDGKAKEILASAKWDERMECLEENRRDFFNALAEI